MLLLLLLFVQLSLLVQLAPTKAATRAMAAARTGKPLLLVRLLIVTLLLVKLIIVRLLLVKLILDRLLLVHLPGRSCSC
jgi:hypothetical protein